MDSLRERVNGIVKKVGLQLYHRGLNGSWEGLDDYYEPNDATDEIIASFEAVLLSDEVVEAAVMGMGNCMREHGTVVYESNRMPQPRDLARAALQAALAAAKGTEGGE